MSILTRIFSPKAKSNLVTEKEFVVYCNIVDALPISEATKTDFKIDYINNNGFKAGN